MINEVNNPATSIIVEFDDNRILLGQYNIIIIFNIYNYIIEKTISNEKFKYISSMFVLRDEDFRGFKG